MKKRMIIILGVALAAGAVLAPIPAAASGELIDAAPTLVELAAPAPGQSQEWTMSVRNLTDGELPIALAVSGSAERLFDGPYPLELELTETGSGQPLYIGTAAAAIDEVLLLPTLAGHADYELSGSVTLPSEAGNEYQEATGRLSFEFRTSADDASDESGLASTGPSVWPWLWAAGIAFLAGTVALIRRRRTS
ncbi:hypothetical protein [Agromyces archimandritae]|uniref:LPXTG cell wall anchor domain-containing protein n=1 Tax=Agromyces archimandritae TaxID=2781962 RepID=A0A975IMI9_9MICO|nr:hypothetical protein [Agromyces archimandritae]QTX03500.1 hypothetical protein G127AT_09015 [Agromyces archimandritae]